MIITYLRSSAIANWSFCQQQYYLNYVLGHQTDAGIKAEKGTIVHKVMEVLAKCKLALQNGENVITDDVVGELYFTEEELYSEKYLSLIEAEKINSTRVNKDTYPGKPFIKAGQKHFGEEFIQRILDVIYDYYSSHSPNVWKPVDKKDCYNWTWMVLEAEEYDPRYSNIIEPEKFFEFDIKEDWAKFEYEFKGEKISGHLGLKGTIDLICRTPSGILEVVDYKLGRRLNWADGEVKTWKKLQTDNQLLFYFYALHKVLGVEELIFTIYFVRDGGPFSIPFHKDQIGDIEKMIRRNFEEIRDCQEPKLLSQEHRDFRCNKICHYYKNSFEGDTMNMCHRTQQVLQLKGIKETTELLKAGDGFSTYQAPGSTATVKED